jgi:uncharacterized protein
MTQPTVADRRQARAVVIISGDDVYEDLFAAGLKVQEILVRAGFAATIGVGTARLATTGDWDLVVLYTALGLFPESCQRALATAVAGGTGLIALHSSSVYPQSPNGQVAASHEVIADLIGCRFRSHGPEPHESRFTIRGDARHPVTRGLRPFDITHEHYDLEVLPACEVIGWREMTAGAATTAGAAVLREPVCCARELGSGRVCYLQPGHDMRVWDEPGIRELLARAARWASRPAASGEAE